MTGRDAGVVCVSSPDHASGDAERTKTNKSPKPAARRKENPGGFIVREHTTGLGKLYSLECFIVKPSTVLKHG